MAQAAGQVQCPCGGGTYESCCGRFLSLQQIPQTAQELMRSRYTAYTQGDEAYLQASWHHSTRPHEPIVSEDAAKWLGLEIRRHEQNGDEAIVEFVARYKLGGRAHRLHEVSSFVREAGRWFYLDGSLGGAAEAKAF